MELFENTLKRVQNADEAEEYIQKVGILPLFKNEFPGFSLEDHVGTEGWWSGDPEKDPWVWREILAEKGNVAYGKFFQKKACFISKEWLPYFLNFRRDGYDFDSLWEDGKASKREKDIMDLFAGDSADAEFFSFNLRKKAGFEKQGEKGFEGIVTDLQMQLYLCIKGFGRRRNKLGEPYGWSISVYTTPEHLWGYDTVTSAYAEPAEKSAERIVTHLMGVFPFSDEKQAGKAIGFKI